MTDGPPIPREPNAVRAALALKIWNSFDDRTRQIMTMMPKHGVVGDHCRFNEQRFRWEHVMIRRVVNGGRA